MKSRFIILSAIILLLLSSCSQKDISVKEILSKMSACEKDAPAGHVYFSDDKIGDEHFASDLLLNALFGERISMAGSFAIRTSSFAHPYGYAVFKANTSEDVNDIAKMCYSRIETVKNLISREGDEEALSLVTDARVYVSGQYVILLMTDNNDVMLDTVKKVLHFENRRIDFLP